MCLPSLLAFTSLWCLHYPLLRSTQVLQKSCQGNFRKFQGSGKSRFGGSGKDQYFLKIPKWQYKHFLDYKWRKLVSYFLNNVATTCLYGINISENIDIEHVFQCKVFFVSVAITTQVASAPLRSFYFAISDSFLSHWCLVFGSKL